MPWMHKGVFSDLIDVVRDEKPTLIIQLGDLYDLFAFSRWPKKLLITPDEELRQAREQAEEFWRVIQNRAPKAKCVQIAGNHDARIAKTILDKVPEIASLVDIKHLWQFKGVKTHYDYTQEIVIDGIVFMHGFRSKLGQHATYNMQSTVCAHSHKAGLFLFPHKDKLLFEMNAGFIADPEASALQYGLQKKHHWTHSVGLITEKGEPMIIPLHQNKKK